MKDQDSAASASQWFSADRPIETRDEDALDRHGFSETLANAIRGWTGRESLVLALYGAWGNGKSSIKNMVVECLRQSSPAVCSVDFNPWQLANRPRLSEAFFDELGVALGKGDLGSSSRKKSVLNKYRRWALRLQGGQDLAKATRNLFGALLIIFGVITFGSSWWLSRASSLFLGIITVLMGILALTSKIVEGALRFLEAGTEIGVKNIGEIKKEIAEDLQALRTPILVVLDDLDRLTPQEVLEVFQLIKANGDFPNVIYLILCDRTIVETNITKALNVPGRDYLEKIVQVAFDVPMIDIARVRQVLFTRLDSLLSAEGVSTRFSAKRWANMFWSSLHPYFATLRDVNRFISTLAFQFSSLSVDGAFEVNPIDLIGLEVIRLYEPEVYKALQSSKEILTAHKPDGPSAKVTKQALESIIEMGSEDHRVQLTELLKHLFPETEWAFDGPSYSQEFGEKWYRDLRVCSSKLFDRYFRLSVSDEELSQAVAQRLLRARCDREQLRSEMNSLQARGLLNVALEELAIFQGEIEPMHVEQFITAILDVGDLFSDTRRGMFNIPMHWRVAFLIQHSLEKLDGEESRSKALTSAIDNTAGLSMAVEVAAVLTTKSGVEGEEPFFREARATELQESGLRKIQAAAASGALARSPKLSMLLHVWRRWGDAEDAMNSAEMITRTPEGTLQFLRSLEVRSVAHGMSDYVGTERWYIRRDDIEPLISMDTLNSRVKALVLEDLDEGGQRALKSFQKAMARRSAGKPDDGPFVQD
jgi:predicted KAP-like P-loop ATPase